jgi:glucokinase
VAGPVILAGDVGGTKTALGLFQREAGGTLTVLREATLPSRDFASLELAVRQFLAAAPTVAIGAACFGVAGPVVVGRVVTTNLPWVLDEAGLARDIPVARVRLLNDLEATAHGVLALPDSALFTLQQGRAQAGNLAVIAAGTGLGEAFIVREGDHVVVVASEGGHSDFAPRTDLEINVLRALRTEFGRVSYERLVCGPGLVNVYRFLRRAGGAPEPAWLAARMAAEDPATVITEVGLERGDAVCVATLDMFVAVYGAEAGNLALKVLAVGGVFVAGGIAPRLRTRLADGAFMGAFRDKGRFSPLLAQIPVHVVLEPRTALLGAARVACGMAAG